ncbi:hypothetical protein [Herbaspirillum huttiense]|uniref:hypothetical protein n=1 Tax=Herbaspirillum huttiense TaxID=863372 RepID=UPI002E772CF5|nr:hypothetical protein [Herbaspirillum huttiense]MEE1637187.1 hypothetical protein [Herbaspirillum huttiense NC40101]
MDCDEAALTLHEVAARLKLSYSTVFAMREHIGFRLPGSRVWRVWPSRLAELSEKRNNVTRLPLRVAGENNCQSAKIPHQASGGLTSARQASRELDALLARRINKPRKNSTTE